jgi:poly [ADP-ribose] polymerase
MRVRVCLMPLCLCFPFFSKRFDQKMLEHSLEEMQIDTKKLPLGAISRAGMQSAFGVLGELQKVVEDEAIPEEDKEKAIFQLSSKFYFMVPHVVGMQQAPLLSTLEQLKEKVELVQNLMEIELASRMMKPEPDHLADEDEEDGEAADGGGGGGAAGGAKKKRKTVDADEDPLDTHYRRLNTKLKALDKTDPDFEMVQKYLVNTHGVSAHPHSPWPLTVLLVQPLTV